MIENLGMPYQDAEYEVRRYIGRPGQATAYWIGKQRILDLRQQAMDALGESFALAGFHTAVLASGALPLDVLSSSVEAYIGAYIEAAAGAPAEPAPAVAGFGRTQGADSVKHGPGAAPAWPGRPGQPGQPEPGALEHIWRVGACSPAAPGCSPELWLRGDVIRVRVP